MSLSTNHRGERRSWVTDLLLALGALAAVLAVSIIAGSFLNSDGLSSWGQWIGAFIAGLALVATSYAIIAQVRHGEAASWSLALARLGELHDTAHANERLARILTEQVDEKGEHVAEPLALSAQERVWLGSFFLVLEQIYVATLALSPESKRVWRLYLKNSLNKPTIRAAFVADATASKDFHQEFWRFVRGKKTNDTYRDWVIAPHFFAANNDAHVKSTQPARKLVSVPLQQSHLKTWLEIYRDPEVKKQMYAAPTDSEESLSSYLKERRFYSVLNEAGEVVGGFNFYDEHSSMASFGIVLHPRIRREGYGRELVSLMKEEAIRLGYRTLRADVYSDNVSCLSLLDKTGFRRFVWVEANL